MDSCPPLTDCLGGAAVPEQQEVANFTSVRLTNGAGHISAPLDLKTATAAQIEAAVRSVRDATYSAARVTSVSASNTTAVWTLELTTPYGACERVSSSLTPPPLLAALSARVTLSVEILSRASRLAGGVDVSLGDSGRTFVAAAPDVTSS